MTSATDGGGSRDGRGSGAGRDGDRERRGHETDDAASQASPPTPPAADEFPPISDYGLLSDGHSVALVSSGASIDWFCTPRIDSPAVFARLLDIERGGCCRIRPSDEVTAVTREYVERTMVLETTMRTATGELRVRDCLAMRRGGREEPRRQLIREATCVEGDIEVEVLVRARFDFGLIPPWIRVHDDDAFTLVGGSTGLSIWSDAGLELLDRHDLAVTRRLAAGDSFHVSITTHQPERLDDGAPEAPTGSEVAERIDETVEWWQDWCAAREGGHDRLDDHVLRSALVLKSLVHAPTGAIAAAATTSLPEVPGGSWNWDYRFSWIRDSWMTVRSLTEAGFREEADGFERFVERSSAGSANELQLLYGVDGRHRTPEVEIPEIQGYRGARPVREGNRAQAQLQLDMYGYLLELTWRRVQRGATIDPNYQRFLRELVDTVCRRWQEPDHGIWELRGDPVHYVYSKVLCWTAVDRGIRLAGSGDLGDGVEPAEWRRTRDDIRGTILEGGGVRKRDGAFVAVLGGDDIDASLLLVPEFGFVAPDDHRLAATVDAVIDSLDDGGLIRRFRVANSSATEGTFVACTFWLVERLHDLGRMDEAQRYYEQAVATANDLGLFAEEYDPRRGEALGNFPQALSHLAHVGAAVTFARGRSLPPLDHEPSKT